MSKYTLDTPPKYFKPTYKIFHFQCYDVHFSKQNATTIYYSSFEATFLTRLLSIEQRKSLKKKKKERNTVLKIISFTRRVGWGGGMA